jgi:hypothetical protein
LKDQDQVVEVSQVDLDRLCYALAYGVDECDEVNDIGMNGFLSDDFEPEWKGDEDDCLEGAYGDNSDVQDPDVCKSQSSSRTVSLGVETPSVIGIDNIVDAERAKALLSSNVIRSDRGTTIDGETVTQRPWDVKPSIVETQRLNLATGQEVFQCCMDKAMSTQSDAVCGWKRSEVDKIDAYSNVSDQEEIKTPSKSVLTDHRVCDQQEQVGYQDRMYAEPCKNAHRKWRLNKDLCRNPNNLETVNNTNNKYITLECCTKDTCDPATGISTTDLWSENAKIDTHPKEYLEYLEYLPFFHATEQIRDLKPCYLNLGFGKKNVTATVSNEKDFLHKKRLFEPP